MPRSLVKFQTQVIVVRMVSLSLLISKQVLKPSLEDGTAQNFNFSMALILVLEIVKKSELVQVMIC